MGKFNPPPPPSLSHPMAPAVTASLDLGPQWQSVHVYISVPEHLSDDHTIQTWPPCPWRRSKAWPWVTKVSAPCAHPMPLYLWCNVDSCCCQRFPDFFLGSLGNFRTKALDVLLQTAAVGPTGSSDRDTPDIPVVVMATEKLLWWPDCPLVTPVSCLGLPRHIS